MADGSSLRWLPGTSYGPVLSTTDLYLLNPRLELHPILTNSLKSFHLNFNLATGQTGGFNPDNQDRDLAFAAKDEMATLPRVKEIIIITPLAPWCTIIKNDRGVSLADVCGTLWREYSDFPLTEEEFGALPPTHQERVRRTAMIRETGYVPQMWGQPTVHATRCKRIDWLRDRIFFDGLARDEDFARARLGFSAPNIFKLSLIQ